MESRAKYIYVGNEVVVFGQIQPQRIGLLGSRNSQIPFRDTPNTMPIKDGLTKLYKKKNGMTYEVGGCSWGSRFE